MKQTDSIKITAAPADFKMPFLTNSADDIKKICQPMTSSLLECGYFQHNRFFNNKTYFSLSSDPSWVMDTTSNKAIIQISAKFHADIIQKTTSESLNYRCCAWSMFADPMMQLMFNAANKQYNISNGVVLIYINEHYTDFFYFGTDRDNTKGEVTFVQNSGELQKFILYYLDRASKIIACASAARRQMLAVLGSNTVISPQQKSPNLPISIKRYFMGDAYLTQREVDCLMSYAKGYSYKFSASYYNISPLTVKKHLENAKSKLGCKNMVELIIKTAKAGIIQIEAL